MAKSLYICYFGVREPLVQTQVIPYLRELVKAGHQISLVTFEGQVAELLSHGVTELKKELADQGIEWHWLRYHKRFSAVATAWDILCGTWFVWRFIGRERPDILHGRVHVPTLMGALARKFSRHKPKLLFDIRGFFPEEYTDAGIWPENGLLYRGAKRVELWLMKEADGFVVLTEKAREILFPESVGAGFDRNGRPVEVIPCCVDLSRFRSLNGTLREDMRISLGVGNRFVVVYVGSFGGWYMTDEMIDLFAASRRYRTDAFTLILTQRDKDKIATRLRKRGFADTDFLVKSVQPTEVAAHLSAADIAVSFIRSCYSKQSSSPTKIAEYLASGLPIIANSGVGDIDGLLAKNGVGVIIDDLSQGSYLKAFQSVEALGDIRSKCRQLSATEFDLASVGGQKYRYLYSRLMGNQYDSNGKVPKSS